MRGLRDIIGRISRLEVGAAGVAAITLLVLVALEPDILQAPFENGRTVAFVAGGTAAAAVGLGLMLWFRVPSPLRLAVVGVPFVAVSWWLIAPFFLDDVADDAFDVSIGGATPMATAPGEEPAAAGSDSPVLLGSGQFVGLAGHDGSGDAGFFALPDESVVLRLENFDIDNGPDLRLYVVPGADQTTPSAASVYLGELRGNRGNQTYELPSGFDLTPGDWTVLVWCEAFTVEFVAATVAV
jgi:hypothetical protein